VVLAGYDQHHLENLNVPDYEYHVELGQVSLHPGSSEQPSVARWTTPSGAAGSYTIDGQFYAGDSGIMQVDVRINGTGVWQATDFGSFQLASNLLPGDTVDFAVYGGYGYGNTPLDATIQLVPEPASLALFALGGIALLAAAE